MPERLCRASPVDLELRGDGRTVVGIAMPFDQPTEIREDGQTYTEVFRRGSFTKTIAERGPQGVKTACIAAQRRTEPGRDITPRWNCQSVLFDSEGNLQRVGPRWAVSTPMAG